MDAKMTSGAGFVLLIIAFLSFLFYGNVAPAIAILALGVVLVAAVGRGSAKASAEGDRADGT
jgi:hypothetical protein